ncbi:MAG: iron dicitrate transport regulator FecR, partial [Bacteroidales bacterium]|nr:iron dicitrate transport regulator FecR [Bacteroidales bacterium]
MNPVESYIKREADAIRQIPVDDSYDRAIDLIYKRVHEQRGKVVVSGMGKAGQIALAIATTFS